MGTLELMRQHTEPANEESMDDGKEKDQRAREVERIHLDPVL
jgi:hypothetical protein